MTSAAASPVARARTADPHLAHVRQVEQADALAHRAVLIEDARVLDGHLPAGEVDEPATERAVTFYEGGLLQIEIPATSNACSTSWRSVGKVSMCSASWTGKKRTSVELVVVLVEAPPVTSIRKKWTVLWMRSPSS